VKHFKQDLAEVERLRGVAKRDHEPIFSPATNLSNPLRRTDGARPRRYVADPALVGQGAADRRAA
jgi:hypothetical protein